MGYLGKWFIGYGAFLIICGLAGYASNPAAAKTALISGSVFGGLAIAVGFGLPRFRPVRYAALGLLLLLIAAFTWRSFASWQAVTQGEPKVFAASLISAMLIASILTLVKTLQAWSRP